MFDGTLHIDEDVTMGSIDESALIAGGRIVVAAGVEFKHH